MKKSSRSYAQAFDRLHGPVTFRHVPAWHATFATDVGEPIDVFALEVVADGSLPVIFVSAGNRLLPPIEPGEVEVNGDGLDLNNPRDVARAAGRVLAFRAGEGDDHHEPALVDRDAAADAAAAVIRALHEGDTAACELAITAIEHAFLGASDCSSLQSRLSAYVRRTE